MAQSIHYSTSATYNAYCKSWGYYFSGRPIGPYQHATILVGRPSRQLEVREFVRGDQISIGLKQQKLVKLVDPKTIFQPPAILEDKTKRWAVDELSLDAVLLQPPPPPAILNTGAMLPPPRPFSKSSGKQAEKRKRTATPEEMEIESEVEIVPAPKRSRGGGKTVPGVSDEEVARRLHAQMNARGRGGKQGVRA
ncbi:hypothetical protein LTR10_010473 [Elasticomyces elasticus]|uniref:Uncharacterized protein n=1 Tax=Elasticomyces elasticus TaxID=574655 RepID=A0AAN7W327_9PEZI|nr:hypothetical protein LTR10_010473 [Elasticomyces elasticus]KAK4972372.1 hypothetical protein LTR42_006881 [Elasticomyces elasticus]KAK5697257.1 hypothetical protein LTR97_007393 [Elasticomyces elasticus]